MNPYHPTELPARQIHPSDLSVDDPLVGVSVMFDRSWMGYPCPSLFECLIVFAIVFLAGSLWPFFLQWYVEYLREEDVHA